MDQNSHREPDSQHAAEIEAAVASHLETNARLNLQMEEAAVAAKEIQDLKTERFFLASIVDSFQDAVMSIDTDKIITGWNRSAHKIYGYSRAEVIGKPFSMLALPADLDSMLETLLSVQDSQQGETSYTIRLNKNGREMWLSITLSPIRNEAGKVMGVSTVARDISEHRVAEVNSQQNSERLRMIIETVTEYAIFSLGLDRKIITWNSGAQALLGYTAEEAIGSSGDIIFTEEDRARAAPENEASTAVSEGRAADERWHLRKDGSRFWASGVMMAMRNSEEKVVGLVKIFRDMTDQLAATDRIEQSRQELWSALQEMEKARTEAEAAAKAKDHFLAIVSHELRTPLTPVLMTVNSLSRRTDLPERVREGLQMIKRNVEIESHFIDDLLEVTRINRQKFEIVKKPLDLHEVIRAGSAVALPDITAKDQQLSVNLEATSYNMDGDFTRLQQVVWNLLKNASKFTPKKGWIKVQTRNIGDCFVLVISDNGIGIPAEALPRIFDAFDQGSQGTSRAFGGLGLGLAISKATIDAHGGSIRADSDGCNCGATFTIELSPPGTSATSN